ncbi:MAG: TAXI family TRAP transporter solute-binding subunit, partial [Acidobacteria bacterium]|nr:TAXI family TRAP transporter solute-binding subunit [Acidobacteriota bacterium]
MTIPRFSSRLLLPAVLLAILSSACGPGQQASKDEAPAQAAADKRFLSVGTAPPGGAFFVVGGALAEVLEAHPGDSGWRVTAEATKGSQENIRRIDRGEIDLALSNSAITYFAVRGEGGWEKAYDLRAIMTLAPNVALFITPGSSGVERIADLRGQRVVMGPSGAGFEYFLRPILAAHGLTYDDLTPLYNTQVGAVDMLGDGSAAAAFLGGAIPTASITQAAAGQDIYFVPFDPEARERLIADYLFFRPATIPAGTYRGMEEDFAGLDVGSMHLITSASQDEELVYRV